MRKINLNPSKYCNRGSLCSLTCSAKTTCENGKRDSDFDKSTHTDGVLKHKLTNLLTLFTDCSFEVITLKYKTTHTDDAVKLTKQLTSSRD